MTAPDLLATRDTSSDLSAALLLLLDDATRDAVAGIASLPALLADGLGAARDAWPGVGLAERRFVEQVAAALTSPDDAARLPRLPYPELFLAAACADGDPVAVDRLVRTYRPSLEVALRRLALVRADIDDVLQKLWESLLLADGRRPHIADFRGRGDLRWWLRASAVRIAYRVRDRARRDVLDGEIADMADSDCTAEVAYLKRRYAAEFRDAFEVAMAALSTRQRALLRRHYLDGLTGDQLGALYGGVHRTTATRWVAEARQLVFVHTQRELRERLCVSEAELASVLRLVESQLDVSVERILASAGKGEP